MAKQHDEELREQFTINVSLYSSNMLVFVDESGSDCRDSIRKYGYGLRGDLLYLANYWHEEGECQL